MILDIKQLLSLLSLSFSRSWNEHYQDATVNKIVRYMADNPYDSAPHSQPDTPTIHGTAANRIQISGKGKHIRDAFKSMSSKSLDY